MQDQLLDVQALATLELPLHRRDSGQVVVAEVGSTVPFSIARMFTVSAPLDAVRGEHAHRKCSQFMLCVNGMVDVTCDDGGQKRTFTLDRPNLALLVPPSIWNVITFRSAGAVLAVLCDRPYEEADYLRDYSAFLAFRATNG
jgi:WxcM-like, C-terminal